MLHKQPSHLLSFFRCDIVCDSLFDCKPLSYVIVVVGVTLQIPNPSKMSTVCADVAKDKQIFLFKRMCEEAGYSDPTLTDYLVSGVPLAGHAGDCPQFPQKATTPTMMVEQ